MTVDFYQTAEWQALSARIRSEDGKCLRCGTTSQLCADHIIPRKLRVDLSLCHWNLQTLCWECNEQKGAYYVVSFRRSPDRLLEREIAIEQQKAFVKFRKYADKVLRKSNLKAWRDRQRVEPSEVTVIDNYLTQWFLGRTQTTSTLEKCMVYPIQLVLFPFICPVIILIAIVRSVKESAETRPDKAEIDEMASFWTQRKFSDWNSFAFKCLNGRLPQQESRGDVRAKPGIKWRDL
jgi:hypothetical protein